MRCGALKMGVILIAAQLVFFAQPLNAAAPGKVEAQPCPPSAAGLNAHCAALRLGLGGSSRPKDMVTASVVILPAANRNAKRAVFILEGGPGLKASDAAQEFARDWNQLRAEHDLVIFDTRGLDENGLYCEPAAGEKKAAFAAQIFPLELIERCRRELELKTDLRRYTSTIMAQDLDAMRKALSYDQISLISYSYGTRLAQEYVRLFPDHVSSAVMLGPARMDVAYPTNLARETEEVFDLIIKECAADAACAAAYPNLASDRDEMLRRLAADGLPASVSYDGERHDLVIKSEVVTAWLRSRLYGMDSAMKVPQLIHQLATGNTGSIGQSIVEAQRSLYSSTALGLWLSLSCSEDVAFVDLPSARELAGGTIVGEARLTEQVAACGKWPQASLRDGYRDAVTTSVPILLVTGGYDPATRPADAKIMLSGFKNGDWLHIPNESHLFRADWENCIGALASDFVRRGGWPRGQRPDTSCVTRIKRPSFALPN